MSQLFRTPRIPDKYFAKQLSTWGGGELVLRIPASLLVCIYVARYLGPERFGLLSYAVNFCAA